MAQYYVPEGNWTNFLTGECVQGGKWINDKHGYKSIPMLVRPNSLIAIGNNSLKPDYDYREGVQIAAYGLIEGKVASTQVINMNEEVELDVSVLKANQTVNISFKGNNKAFSIILKGIMAIEKLEGGSFTIESDGIHIVPHIAENQVICYL